MSAEIVWKEVNKFHPLPKAYYEKQQARGSNIPPRLKARPIQTTSSLPIPTRPHLPTSGLYIPNRKQISQLIQFLAISETQKMKLEHQINEITRQKEELNEQLTVAIKAKEDILKEQKHSQMETSSILACKTQEIELLHKKLKDLEEGPKTNNDSEKTEELDISITRKSSLRGLEERLNQIQNDIKALSSRIPNDKKEKDTISGTSNTSKVAASLSDDHSSLSQPSSLFDHSSRANDDLPSLELLLRKILKAKKVHYKDHLDEQEASEHLVNSIVYQQKPEPMPSTPQLGKQKVEKKSPQKKSIFIIDETKSKNAATSPPNESYLSFVGRMQKAKRREKKKKLHTKDQLALIHHHSVKETSSCACATCSSNVSWVCPDCFHSDRSASFHHNHADYQTLESRPDALRDVNDSFNQKKPFADNRKKEWNEDDASVLFANDTSMFRPLADIVSDMDQIPINNQNVNFSTPVPKSWAPSYDHRYFNLSKKVNLEAENNFAVQLSPIYVLVDDRWFDYWVQLEIRICWSASDPIDFSLHVCTHCGNQNVVRIDGRFTGIPTRTFSFDFIKKLEAYDIPLSIILEPSLVGIPITMIYPILIILLMTWISWTILIPVIEKRFQM